MRQIPIPLRQRLRLDWGMSLIALASVLRVAGFLAQNHWPRWRFPMPSLLAQWRKRFLSVNEATDELGLVRGMFLGEASALPNPVLAAFREGGLAHLVAASGFNCLIVGMLVRMACMPLLRRVPIKNPALAERICETAGALLFWCWTDQSPPITRAATIALARLSLAILGIPTPLSRLLTLQYLLSLAMAPYLWRSVSFQLSFACLFGVLAGAKIARRWQDGPRPSPLLMYAFTNIGACIAVSPITWIFFGEINFTGLITNWIAVPPVTTVIMPLAMIQMALLALPGPLSLQAAHLLGALNGSFCGLYFDVVSALVNHGPSLRYAPFHD